MATEKRDDPLTMVPFEALKGRHRGESCVVLGNGPSLTVGLIESIREAGVYSFAANGFCLMFDETNFRPNSVCMSNYDAIRTYGERYPASTCKFFKSGWRSRRESDVENVYELPFACEHDLGRHGAGFIKDGHFSLDPSVENFCGDTVLLDFAVPMAFYMGFTRVYFAGVDCDYSRGYFSGDYKKSTPRDFRGMITGDYSIAIPSYRFARDFLSSHGCELYKLTKSERLDFIPMRTLGEAFEERGR